jgi:hypothetical protein
VLEVSIDGGRSGSDDDRYGDDRGSMDQKVNSKEVMMDREGTE